MNVVPRRPTPKPFRHARAWLAMPADGPVPGAAAEVVSGHLVPTAPTTRKAPTA